MRTPLCGASKSHQMAYSHSWESIFRPTLLQDEDLIASTEKIKSSLISRQPANNVSTCGCRNTPPISTQYGSQVGSELAWIGTMIGRVLFRRTHGTAAKMSSAAALRPSQRARKPEMANPAMGAQITKKGN